MKRLSATVIALLLLLTACGQAAVSPDGNDLQNGQPDQTAETTTEDPLADGLPDTDLEGQEFRIWAGPWDLLDYIYVDELNGDVINDAVYTAVNNVRERFNVNIIGHKIEDLTINTSNNAIGTSILAGEDFCEILCTHDRTMACFSLAGMLANVNDLPYIDYSKPWWPSRTINTLTVNGIMYLISNSIEYWGLSGMATTYFNKDRLDSYGIAYPYQTVLDGKWTLDELTSLCKDAYQDVNGDGNRDNDDFYGFIALNQAYRLVESFEIVPYRADDEQILVLDVDNSRSRELLDKYYKLCFETNGGRMMGGEDSYWEMFAADKAMFTFGRLGDSPDHFRYTDIKYGFLPMPKLNESQENYCTGGNDQPYGVPITNTRHELTGMMIEALSAEGYKNVQPAYFDIAMKQKFTSDTESITMLDIIADNRVLDFGYLYCGDLKLCRFITFLLTENKPSTDFDSFYAKNQSKEQANIDKIIEVYTNA